MGRAWLAARRGVLLGAVALLIACAEQPAPVAPMPTVTIAAAATATAPPPTVTPTPSVAASATASRTPSPARPRRQETATATILAPTRTLAPTATAAPLPETPAPPTPTIEPTLIPMPTIVPTPTPIPGCAAARPPLVQIAGGRRTVAATPIRPGTPQSSGTPVAPATTTPTAPPRPSAPGTPTIAPTPTVATPTPTPTLTPSPTLGQEVAALTASYAARGLDAGIVIAIDGADEPARIDADGRYATASLYKLFVLWRLQVEIAAGGLVDDERLTYCPQDDDSDEDGSQLGAYGDTFAVTELRRLMIVRSNNTAAYILARRLGWGEIERMLATRGFAHTSAQGGVSTPAEIARFFRGLLARDLDPRLGTRDYATMLEVLRAQEINHLLPAGLPPGTPFAHKTGNLAGVLNDAGIVTLPDGRAMIIVAMTQGSEAAAEGLMHDLAALAWRYAVR